MDYKKSKLDKTTTTEQHCRRQGACNYLKSIVMPFNIRGLH